MGKRKLKEEIPESVCLFNAKEIAYIVNCAKMMPFEIDIQTAEIRVTEDRIKEAQEHLTVRHLINQFGFVIQTHIVADYNTDKVFDPVLKKKSIPIHSTATDVVIGIGTEFTDTRDFNKRKRIFSESKDEYTIVILNSMQPNYQVDKIAFNVGVKHGLFVL